VTLVDSELLVGFTLLIYAAVANGAIHNKENKENRILTAGLFGEAYSLKSHYYVLYRENWSLVAFSPDSRCFRK
jgi:hypothetical protein